MTNPIETAVAPLEALAVEQAEIQARAYVAKIAAALEAAEFKIDDLAPRWSDRRHPWGDYKIMTAKRAAIESVTVSTNPDSYEGRMQPQTRGMSPAKIERFVAQCREDAAASYRAYVAKLIAKIGDVTEATLVSTAGVWGSSSLKVVTIAGDRQVWNTQQIVNVSVHGKLFNQWPTRQAKKGW